MDATGNNCNHSPIRIRTNLMPWKRQKRNGQHYDLLPVF
jgi:hypothetical protein